MNYSCNALRPILISSTVGWVALYFSPYILIAICLALFVCPRYLMPWLGSGLGTSNGGKWHSRRKLLTPAFHFKLLESFLDVGVQYSFLIFWRLVPGDERRVRHSLQRFAGSPDCWWRIWRCPPGRPLQLLTFNYYVLSSSSQSHFVTSTPADLPIFSPPPTQVANCALDIICETAMGRRLGAQQSSESEYVKAVCEASDLVNKRITSPWLWNDLIYSLSPMGARWGAWPLSNPR